MEELIILFVCVHCCIPGMLLKHNRLSTNIAIHAMSLFLLGKLKVGEENVILHQSILGISDTLRVRLRFKDLHLSYIITPHHKPITF